MASQQQQLTSIPDGFMEGFSLCWDANFDADVAPAPATEAEALYGELGDEQSDDGDGSVIDGILLAKKQSGPAGLPRLTGRPAVGRDWNEKFQTLLSRRNLDPATEIDRVLELRKLCEDFSEVSKQIGIVIINELHLPDDEKTIPPISAASSPPQPSSSSSSSSSSSVGVAGGRKYIYPPEGLFFKFCLDTYGLYGGDEYSMKAAGHEMRSLMELIDCRIEGLHYPLMVLIDYRGYRLMAEPILPIDADTLAYGSADGCRSIAVSKGPLLKRIKLASRMLNLKPHDVFPRGDAHHRFARVYTPVDLEAHVGRDQRFYVLDAHRIFPPSTPVPNVQGCYLYQLLRPELVKNYQAPLCSDAFSQWDVEDLDVHNREAAEATQSIFTHLIPAAALDIDAQPPDALPPHELVPFLHSRGINARYVGYVRARLHSDAHRGSLLLEALGRTLKNILRGRMRAVASSQQHDYANVIRSLLDLVFGAGDESLAFWSDPLRLKGSTLKRFPQTLSQQEFEPSFDLRASVSLPALCARFTELTSIHAPALPPASFNNPALPRPYHDADVSFAATSRTFHAVAYEEGNVLSHAGVRASADSDALFELATLKYGEALRIKPNAINILHNWALSLTYQAAEKPVPDALRLYSIAAAKLAQCRAQDPRDGQGLFLWGNILTRISQIVDQQQPGWDALSSATVDLLIAAAPAVRAPFDQLLAAIRNPSTATRPSPSSSSLLPSNAPASPRGGVAPAQAAVAEQHSSSALQPWQRPEFWHVHACLKYEEAHRLRSKEVANLLFNWGNALVALGTSTVTPDALRGRLFREAVERYQQSNGLKNRGHTLKNWAIALSRLARATADEQQAHAHFQQSDEVFAECARLRPDDTVCFFNWGNMCYRRASRHVQRRQYTLAFDSFLSACAKYSLAVTVGAFDMAAYSNWGNSLAEPVRIAQRSSVPLSRLVVALEKFLAFFVQSVRGQSHSVAQQHLPPLDRLLSTREPFVEELVHKAVARALMSSRLQPDTAQLLRAFQQQHSQQQHVMQFGPPAADPPLGAVVYADAVETEFAVVDAPGMRLRRYAAAKLRTALGLPLAGVSPSPSSSSSSSSVRVSAELASFCQLMGLALRDHLLQAWETAEHYVLLHRTCFDNELSFQINLQGVEGRENCVRFYGAELVHFLIKLRELGVRTGYINTRALVLSSRGHLCLYRFAAAARASQLAAALPPDVPRPPELLAGAQQQRSKVEIWYLGLCLFQLLGGRVADAASPLRFSSQWSPATVDFLRSLLDPDPDARPTLLAIQQHPYFHAVEWTQLDRRRPPLASIGAQSKPASQDTGNFHPFATVMSAQVSGSFHGNTIRSPD